VSCLIVLQTELIVLDCFQVIHSQSKWNYYIHLIYTLAMSWMSDLAAIGRGLQRVNRAFLCQRQEEFKCFWYNSSLRPIIRDVCYQFEDVISDVMLRQPLPVSVHWNITIIYSSKIILFNNYSYHRLISNTLTLCVIFDFAFTLILLIHWLILILSDYCI